MFDPEKNREESEETAPTNVVAVSFDSASADTPSVPPFPPVSSSMDVPMTSALPPTGLASHVSSSTCPGERVFLPVSVSSAAYDDPLPSSSSFGDETLFYTIPTHPPTSMGDPMQVTGNPIVIPASGDSFHEDSSHHLRGLSDLGIGPSSGPSDSVGMDSTKTTSPRGNSSSGTYQVGTSIVLSSNSGPQRVSLSKTKMGFIREKLRELKALIPPPVTPDMSHTAAALQV